MYSVIFALFVTAVLLCTIVPAAAFRADAVVQATDPLIRWSGRAVPTSSGAVTWDWIGVQAVFTVSNATYVRAVISDSTLYGGRLSVWGQGVVTGSQRLPWADFATDVSGGGQQQYVLARGMGSDPVTLTLRSQLDPDYMGVGPGMNITLYSFSTDGQFTHTPYSATGTGRSMEVIGDSATTGSGARFYAPCHSSSVTNIYDGTYSDLLCSNIGAVCNVVATSSAGVLCSAGDTCDPQAQYTSNMPHSYDFGLAGCRNGGCPPGPASAWNFSSFIPDAILVNIGSNDFSSPARAGNQSFESAFIATLSAWLHNITTDRYGDADIPLFIAAGPVQYAQIPALHVVIETWNSFGGNATFLNLTVPGDLHPLPSGCDGMPSPIMNAAVAQVATQVVQQVMGW